LYERRRLVLVGLLAGLVRVLVVVIVLVLVVVIVLVLVVVAVRLLGGRLGRAAAEEPLQRVEDAGHGDLQVGGKAGPSRRRPELLRAAQNG
jgi:hypothetical protein